MSTCRADPAHHRHGHRRAARRRGVRGVHRRVRPPGGRTQYHIGQAEVAEIILEPHVGGRWYERGVDGSECDWGRVLAWEPPQPVVFTWQINGAWQFDPDPEHASEIEVRFPADGPEQTTVEVEHRHFERLVGGQAIHGAINGGGGWAAAAGQLRARPSAEA